MHSSSSSASFRFLGTGASAGVPVIGCSCVVCLSSSPYNKRLRPSGLLFVGEKKILIDAGPDLRMQALTAHISGIDGLFLTHTHFDHIAGIDDLRAFYRKTGRPIPVLLSRASYGELERRYHYLLEPGGSSAQLEWSLLPSDAGETSFLGLAVRYFTYQQGGMLVTGYRVGSFAYLTDIRDFPATIFSFLLGVRVLVIGALCKEPTSLHFGFEEAVDFGKKVGAEEIFITHMNHTVDYEGTSNMLPPGVRLAYDGLEVSFGI
ncbi:MAG: MBL fold metallo-hydrolase [Verrucomicrobiota bacterium]|nr:MBL fold metallo-hydrolase [Verrucomicrobiota bacterium]